MGAWGLWVHGTGLWTLVLPHLPRVFWIPMTSKPNPVDLVWSVDKKSVTMTMNDDSTRPSKIPS